jgi:hypothetical protein
VGDFVEVDGRRLAVDELDGLRVSRVRIGPPRSDASASSNGEDSLRAAESAH